MLVGIAVAHMGQISRQCSISVLEEGAGAVGMNLNYLPRMDEQVRVKFNPDMESFWFSGLIEERLVLGCVDSASMLVFGIVLFSFPLGGFQGTLSR